jgi:hypothetical protein
MSARADGRVVATVRGTLGGRNFGAMVAVFARAVLTSDSATNESCTAWSGRLAAASTLGGTVTILTVTMVAVTAAIPEVVCLSSARYIFIPQRSNDRLALRHMMASAAPNGLSSALLQLLSHQTDQCALAVEWV